MKSDLIRNILNRPAWMIGFLLLFISVNGYSQILNWANSLHGSDSVQVKAVKTDPAGNIYVVGNFNSPGVDFNNDGTNDIQNADSVIGGTYDIFLAKYDAAGNFINAIDIGGSAGNDYGEDLALDNTGHIVVVGYFTSDNGMDFNFDGFYEMGGVAGNTTGFIAYLNPDFSYNTGTEISGGYSVVRAVTINKLNNIFVTGEFSNDVYFGVVATSRNGSVDAFLAKFNTTLGLNFVVTFGGDGKDAGLGITSDPSSGNVAITGYFSGSADLDNDTNTGPGGYETDSKGANDLFLIKWNSANGYIWSQTIGGTASDEGNDVAIDNSGNVYVTGYFNNSASVDANPDNDLTSLGNTDALIAKYDGASGSMLWARPMGTAGKDFGSSVVVDNNGDINVTGSVATHIFLAKLNSDNQLLRNKLVPGSRVDYGTDIDIDPNNNDILLTGAFTSPELDFNSDGTADVTLTSNQDGFLLQFEGTPSSTTALPDLIAQNQTVTPAAIALGSSGNISVDILNQGNADMSGSSHVNVYLSLDSLVDAKDSLILTFPISGISQNNSVNLSADFQFNPPISQRDYVILFRIDPDDFIYESDETNNTAAYRIKVTEADQNAPDIQFTGNIPTSVLKDTGQETVQANITDASGVKNAWLYFKKILSTGTQWSKRDLSRNGDLFSTVITSTDLDEIGMEYFIAAQDSASNQDSTVHKFIYLDYGNSESITGLGVGSTQADYRMFSIPFKLSSSRADSIFSGTLGQYDNSKWRLFDYSNGQYHELSSTSSTLLRGQGYWLIKTVGGDIPLNNPQAPNVTPDNPTTITLKAGWNLIGNPYPFNISWQEILDANNISDGVGNLNFWNGTTYNENDIMNKYQGAFVMSNAPHTLVIPLKKTSARMARIESDSTPDQSLDSQSWLIPLHLSSDQIYNNYGGIGMEPGASGGPDRYDRFSIPPFVSYLNLDHDGEKFYGSPVTRSVVPEADRYTWSFSVNTSLKDKLITMSWVNKSFQNDSSTLWLTDLSNGRSIDMKLNSSYSFKSTGQLRFRIDYDRHPGNEKRNICLPYPNPFNELTRFNVTIPANKTVHTDITVYNSSGNRISDIFNGILSAGWHEMSWNGLNYDGASAPYGLYYIVINLNEDGINRMTTMKVIKRK